MELKYSVSKQDVLHWYLKRWQAKLWRFHLLFFLVAAGFAYSKLSDYGLSQAAEIFISCAIGLAILLPFPLFPLLMHKSTERTIKILGHGIETKRGNEEKVLQWKKIESVINDEKALFIIGKNQNEFIIPNRFFASDGLKNEFAKSVADYISKSK